MTGGATSGTEALTGSEMEGVGPRKEKKKKKSIKPKELLQHREKVQPDKLKCKRNISPTMMDNGVRRKVQCLFEVEVGYDSRQDFLFWRGKIGRGRNARIDC